jgi:hypothetical protein
VHTSGLLITIDDENAIDRFTSAMKDRCLTVGERRGRVVAAVLECPDAGAAEAWHRSAVDMPGITGIEVVFVHWDESEPGANDGGN